MLCKDTCLNENGGIIAYLWSLTADFHGLMKTRAVIFLMITALLWSSGGLLIKLVAWNPMAIAGTRSAIAALVMIIFRRSLKFNWGFAQLGGAFCYAGTVILFVTGRN